MYGHELEQHQSRRQLLTPSLLQTSDEQMKGRTDELVEKRCLSRHRKTLHEKLVGKSRSACKIPVAIQALVTVVLPIQELWLCSSSETRTQQYSACISAGLQGLVKIRNRSAQTVRNTFKPHTALTCRGATVQGTLARLRLLTCSHRDKDNNEDHSSCQLSDSERESQNCSGLN